MIKNHIKLGLVTLIISFFVLNSQSTAGASQSKGVTEDIKDGQQPSTIKKPSNNISNSEVIQSEEARRLEQIKKQTRKNEEEARRLEQIREQATQLEQIREQTKKNEEEARRLEQIRKQTKKNEEQSRQNEEEINKLLKENGYFGIGGSGAEINFNDKGYPSAKIARFWVACAKPMYLSTVVFAFAAFGIYLYNQHLHTISNHSKN